MTVKCYTKKLVLIISIFLKICSQVSESLHAIGNLQERERTLGQRCREYEVEVEILNEVAEGSKNKLKASNTSNFNIILFDNRINFWISKYLYIYLLY